jgi:hypothetical protein
MTVTWPSVERHTRESLLEDIQGLSISMLRSATTAMAFRNPKTNASVTEIGGGCIAFAGTAVPFSCAIGVGTDALATNDDLNRIESFYKSRNTPARVVISERTDSGLPPMLRSRKYQPVSVMQNWWLSLEDRHSFCRPDGVEIVQAEFDEADLWTKTVAAGFLEENSSVNEADIPGTMLDTFFCLGFAYGAQAFFAKLGGRVVGGGVLHISGATASIRTTSCRIAHRNKGVQTALLASRLNCALRNGCRVVFSNTDRPGPSARNLHRFGFRTLSVSRTMVSHC